LDHNILALEVAVREDKLMMLEDDREGATVEFCFLPWQIVAEISDFFLSGLYSRSPRKSECVSHNYLYHDIIGASLAVGIDRINSSK
jgi:hypothetical protein